jgi:hypothetical protein
MRRRSRLGNKTAGWHSKKAARERRTIVWVDEVGFYLLAGVMRTYDPRGEMPMLRVPLTRDHLSVIGAATAPGRLLLAASAHVDIKIFMRQSVERVEDVLDQNRANLSPLKGLKSTR